MQRRPDQIWPLFLSIFEFTRAACEHRASLFFPELSVSFSLHHTMALFSLRVATTFFLSRCFHLQGRKQSQLSTGEAPKEDVCN
jgi:hypothetical protein